VPKFAAQAMRKLREINFKPSHLPASASCARFWQRAAQRPGLSAPARGAWL